MAAEKTKVLLIDDNREDFVIVRRMLGSVGNWPYDLEWETSFEAARELINEGAHDAYLIDFRLDPHSGLDLIQESLANGKHQPMILLTAHGSHEVDSMAIRMGASDYLPKSELSPTLLDRTIRHAVERGQLLQKLYHQATHDELTGIFNRKHLMELLATNISAARRHHYPLTLCLCDVDLFKAINDTHGHQSGDRVLVTIGQIFKQKLRNEDIPGRYGGDEFCLVFPHASPQDAQISIERLRRSIQAETFTDPENRDYSITMTFGIAGLQTGEDMNSLIARADKALLTAKQNGRNCTFILEADPS